VKKKEGSDPIYADQGGVWLFAGLFPRFNLFAVFVGYFGLLLAVLVPPHLEAN